MVKVKTAQHMTHLLEGLEITSVKRGIKHRIICLLSFLFTSSVLLMSPNRWCIHPVISGESNRYAERSISSYNFLLCDRTAGSCLSWKVMKANCLHTLLSFLFSLNNNNNNIMTNHLSDVSMLTALCSLAWEEAYLWAPCRDWTRDWSICYFTPSCSRKCTSLGRRTTLVRRTQQTHVTLIIISRNIITVGEEIT